MKKNKWYKLLAICMAWVFVFSFPVKAAEAASSEWDLMNYDSKLLPEDITSSSKTVPWGQRGDYISIGMVTISNEGNGVIGIYGSTDASVACDKIKVKIYLDVKKNGKWTQCKSWEFSDTNNYYVSEYFETTDYATGSYYRLRGAHSVTKGSKVENLSSVTDGVLITK